MVFGTQNLINRPSLDINLQNLPFDDKSIKPSKKWDRKQRRAYQRILSGLKKAAYNGETVRFATLTTADGVEYDRISNDFSKLAKRARRRYGKFEYFKIRTSEGNGVLHVLVVSPYIPQTWLSYNWLDIHDSPIVDIRSVENREKQVARYIASQHLAGQDLYVRSSWSWGWVFKGFVKKWKEILDLYYDSRGIKYCIGVWDRYLMNSLVPDSRHIVEAMEKEREKERLRKRRIRNQPWWYGRMSWLGHGESCESIYKKNYGDDT